jgi:GNAT superfamily N-acetyltransferase
MDNSRAKLPVVSPILRPATADDARTIRRIEVTAGQRFREVGLPDVADHDPTSEEDLWRAATAGRCWVAVDHSDEAIGEIQVSVVDSNGHIDEVSVLPDHQGIGVGRALVARACAWAAEQGFAAVTLTTFTDVSWNAPLYRHLGFVAMADDELGPELRDILREEAERGLDPIRRVCMRLPTASRLR